MKTIECPECDMGWQDASGPGYSAAGYARADVRHDRHGHAEVRCDRCGGDGTLPTCAYGHVGDAHELAHGYCDACERIAGIWTGEPCIDCGVLLDSDGWCWWCHPPVADLEVA